jgi:excinuclease ABC subunit B
LAKKIRHMEREMLDHARNLEFEQAARARDQLRELKQRLFGITHEEVPAAPKSSVRSSPGKTMRPIAGRR